MHPSISLVQSNSICEIELPSLQSIEIGFGAFDSASKVIMEGKNTEMLST